VWTKDQLIITLLCFFPPDFSGDYGSEPGAGVAMPRVGCQGNEASLATCPHGSWQDSTCASGPHAGVKCIGRYINYSSWIIHRVTWLMTSA